jgi:hypothetical protein
MFATYASLRDAREALKEITGATADDTALLNALRAVTVRMRAILWHTDFLPIRQTRYFDPRPIFAGGKTHGHRLMLDYNLLEALTVVDGSGTTLAASDYVLYPFVGTPKTEIHLDDVADRWQYPASGLYENAIAVTGIWGHHTDYANAWIRVDALTASVTATATTFTVSSPSAADLFGRAPRLSPGMLLRVDDEYMALLAVSGTTLTVRRAQNGTLAAAHASGTDVYVWETEAPIALAAARWASYIVKRRGEFADSELDPAGAFITRYPKDIPADVLGIIKLYHRPGPIRGA